MDHQNLTEQKKREITCLVAENKPLPDKYRFLLFQDRKQDFISLTDIARYKNSDDIRIYCSKLDENPFSGGISGSQGDNQQS